MKQPSIYKNIYGKRVIIFRKNMPSLQEPDDKGFSSQFARSLKVNESQPEKGQQRFNAKQRIGKGLRIL